jgi:hypothetical protein
MDHNDELLADLAAQLGFAPPDSSGTSGRGETPGLSRISALADQYKGKSDRELIDEIMKVKHSLKQDRAQFESRLRAIKALRPMMGKEQQAKLEKLVLLLEEED